MVKVLITGVRGKVGRATAVAIAAAGHEVVGTDLGGPINFDAPKPGEYKYIVANLADAGEVFGLVSFTKPDVIVHVAAIPEPYHHPNHVVFQNNIMATFNVLEAAVRCGVNRLVNISSETVPGFFFPEVPFHPPYCPVDESTPIAPQDPYALSKHFGEQMCDAAIRRAPGTSIVTIRPSWVQTPHTIASNLGRYVRDKEHVLYQPGMWAYIWVDDLAEAITLAVAATAPGGSVNNRHEVIYIAAEDNAGGRDLRAAVEKHYAGAVPVRSLARVDASGISSAKASALIGWKARTSWRDWLDAESGELLARHVHD